MLTIIVGLLLVTLILGISFLFYSGIFWVICWAFSWTFSWKMSFGIWLITVILANIFRGDRK